MIFIRTNTLFPLRDFYDHDPAPGVMIFTILVLDTP